MSGEAEAIVTATSPADAVPEPVLADTTPDGPPTDSEKPGNAEQERAEKILKGKELLSQGSRNFLVKSYDEAADELSQVCTIYEEVYGELADELGQPLLLYAKSLIAMALDENKVIDVPDEVNGDEEEDMEEDDDEEEVGATTNGGTKLGTIKEQSDEADSTGDATKPNADSAKPTGVDEVSTTEAEGNGAATDDERPSTSNGKATAIDTNGATVISEGVEDEQMEDENEEGVSGSLQLAWEILEAAAKIFSRQGLSGLPYLADVQAELANIEFENGIFDAAREDFEKALKIHGEVSTKNRRVLAELHYKIGLTYLMQQLNKEGAASLRNSSTLIEEEIAEIQAKEEPTEREKNNILDLEETKQEILAKIQEIEEMQAQTIAEVRAALDSYIKPMSSGSAASSTSKASNGTSDTFAAASSSTKAAGSAGGPSSSSSAISSSSKPTDITHLIKRKKPEEPNSEAEALCSPAKRAAV